MIKMVLASSNAHKLREFREILEPLGYDVVSQHELGIDIDPEETGTTFSENSAIKARAVYEASHLPTVADDSGLVVDALNGEPGVYSARYGGTRDDKAHNDLVLKKLEGVPDEKRSARFVCAVTYIDASGSEHRFEGSFEGRIGYGERGENGFGYDPIFMVGEISSAEMSPEEKNSMSHRGKALRALADYLKSLPGKTLYIADLDGTLLRDDEHTSEYTNAAINGLISRGMLFSLATSRSEVSSSAVISGLKLELPIIAYNGAAIIKAGSGEIIYKNAFSRSDADMILDTLVGAGVYPIVFSFIDSKDRFCYIYDKSTRPQRDYIDTKANDRRIRPVDTVDELRKGDVYYFVCIGDPAVLRPLYEHFEDKFHCLYEVNRYTGEQWFEIIPEGVSKAGAILKLKELTGAERVVSFGDGINDREMFDISDECYAVGNAYEGLKEIATGVIDTNENDGVAKYLEEIFREEK